MNSYLLLFVFLSFISKSYTQTVNQPDERAINGEILPEAIPTKQIVYDYNALSQPTVINSTLKENLKGIWASDEYREILFSTNSITKTLKEYQFYTDIVFDQDSTLHCAHPNYMEADYIILRSDSTLVDMFAGGLVSRIISVENDKMVIQDLDGNNHSLTRVRKESDPKNVTMEVWEGHKIIENSWLKGDYTFESKSASFDLTINVDGTVNSDQNIIEIGVFSYQDSDLIYFEYPDDKHQTYLIEWFSENGITLREIKPLEEEDQPIKCQKTTVMLKRKF